MISNILKLVKYEMEELESELNCSLNSKIPLVNELLLYTIKSGGKRIRPLIFTLAAKMCGYDGPLMPKVSTILEYIHTASLLHDDVVDGALVRRGRPSANKEYGNSITVLSGDYLFAHAFQIAISLPGKDYAAIFSHVVSNMSEGEILQLKMAGNFELTKEEYHHIIYCKTAALFSAGCESAAIISDRSEEERQLLKDYGTYIGYAFQLKDDLLDYFGTEKVIGKTPGTDLDERKITLPTLKLIEEIGKCRVKEIFNFDMPLNERLEMLLNEFKNHNIESKSVETVQTYVDKALECLKNFPDSKYKEALLSITNELRYRRS